MLFPQPGLVGGEPQPARFAVGQVPGLLDESAELVEFGPVD